MYLKAQALESPLGNEYLNSSVLPVLPPLSEIPSSLNANNYHESLHPLGSHNSQPEIFRPNLSTTPALKRNSSLGPSLRQQALNVQTPKKRLSAIGSVSSHGRLYKVLGDLFLLAGRTEDASIWYAYFITPYITHISLISGMPKLCNSSEILLTLFGMRGASRAWQQYLY